MIIQNIEKKIQGCSVNAFFLRMNFSWSVYLLFLIQDMMSYFVHNGSLVVAKRSGRSSVVQGISTTSITLVLYTDWE